MSSRNWPKASCTNCRIRRRRLLLSITFTNSGSISCNYLARQSAEGVGQVDDFLGQFVCLVLGGSGRLTHGCLLLGGECLERKQTPCQSRVGRRWCDVNSISKSIYVLGSIAVRRPDDAKKPRLVWMRLAIRDTSTTMPLPILRTRFTPVVSAAVSLVGTLLAAVPIQGQTPWSERFEGAETSWRQAGETPVTRLRGTTPSGRGPRRRRVRTVGRFWPGGYPGLSQPPGGPAPGHCGTRAQRLDQVGSTGSALACPCYPPPNGGSPERPARLDPAGRHALHAGRTLAAARSPRHPESPGRAGSRLAASNGARR